MKPTTMLTEPDVVLKPDVVVPKFVVIGTRGGPYNIRGVGFGSVKGTVSVGGQIVLVTSWSDCVIKGLWPMIAEGEVVVTHASGAVRRGIGPLV